jgi:phage host-nuclease inhibitor protein Gam
VTDGYRRLVEKHKSLTERAEHEKTKLVEAYATEVTKLHADLDLETRSYTEYCQTVRRRLHDLHEALPHHLRKSKRNVCPSSIKA